MRNTRQLVIRLLSRKVIGGKATLSLSWIPTKNDMGWVIDENRGLEGKTLGNEPDIRIRD